MIAYLRIPRHRNLNHGHPKNERASIDSGCCQLPANPRNSMSLEEVVFWAGVATGMDLSRSMQEDLLDGGSASKIEAYSSLLAYSTKNAVVDITLERLEPSKVQE